MPKKDAQAEQAAAQADGQVQAGQADQATAEQADAAGQDATQDQAAGEAIQPPVASDVQQDRQDQAPSVELVHMVRDTPQYKDGPITADVHPNEVADYSAHDWRVAKD